MINNGDIKTASLMQAIEYHPESIEVMEPVVETYIDKVDGVEVEFSEEIDEDEFKEKFLQEKRMHELAVNLISVRKNRGENTSERHGKSRTRIPEHRTGGKCRVNPS